MSKVQNPNAKGNSGFLWGVGVLLVIIAVVIAYIVFTQKDAKSDKIAESAVDVTLTVSRGDDGVVTLKGENAKADVPEVDLYEDFSCPHCAELAEGSDEPMKQAVEKGELIVNVHPLNFLDLRGQDLDAYLADKSIKLDGHSSTSVSALDILAEAGDAQAYWNLRAYLFENQQTISTWDFEQFAEAAKGFGASDDSVKAISKATVDAGNDIGRANAKKLKEETGSVSSPRVIQDGKDLEKPEDVPVNEWNWVEQVL